MSKPALCRLRKREGHAGNQRAVYSFAQMRRDLFEMEWKRLAALEGGTQRLRGGERGEDGARHACRSD